MSDHIMIDLETLSTRSNAAILQIAAIAFDPLTGYHTGTFNAFVRDLSAYAHVDIGTVTWWMQQSAAPALGKKIETCGVPLGEALGSFVAWFALQGDVKGVWSHGATFDVPVLGSALAAYGLKEPWSYRLPRDTRTLYALAPGGMPAVQGIPQLQHDALYDCEIQVKQVCGALAALRAVTP